MFSHVDLLHRAMMLIPLLLSLTVHEWAHAYSARRLGDDTAEREGRVTLNPLPHIDLFGTILAPMLGAPFGWAKPVPVNATRFRRGVSMAFGTIVTTAAGPLSNLALAVICTVIYGLLVRFQLAHYQMGLSVLLGAAVELNVALFLFNFLPIPPLDGGRIVEGFLPYRLRGAWEEFSRFSWIALLLVILVGARFLDGPRGWLLDQLSRIVAFIATA
jgi:Zn-dependent protease